MTEKTEKAEKTGNFEKNNGIVYISSTLLRFPAVVHSFLGRKGGVSKKEFSSLNMDLRGGDKKEDVEKNREAAAGIFGFRKEALVTMNQVHGDSVLTVRDKNQGCYESCEADAIVTDQTGIPIGVLTADCLPMLFLDYGKNVIAAAHAGWKGTVKGIAEKTVLAMKEKFGSKPEDIIAALGPCIGPCCFVVASGVAAEFKKAFGDSRYIKEGSSPAIDLAGINILQLEKAGVRRKNISIARVCTFCRNDLFFSYRKDGKTTGRQLSFIMLKEAAQ